MSGIALPIGVRPVLPGTGVPPGAAMVAALSPLPAAPSGFGWLYVTDANGDNQLVTVTDANGLTRPVYAELAA